MFYIRLKTFQFKQPLYHYVHKDIPACISLPSFSKFPIYVIMLIERVLIMIVETDLSSNQFMFVGKVGGRIHSDEGNLHLRVMACL